MSDLRGPPRYPGYGGVQPPRDRSGVNGRICSSLVNLKGSLFRDDGQASIEWKAGIDGKRTHLALGFEQIPSARGRPQSRGRPAGAERRLPYALGCLEPGQDPTGALMRTSCPAAATGTI